MEDFPHLYAVTASGSVEGEIAVTSAGLDMLATSPPAEFGGPGDRWSPETLLVASVVDCFVLSYRAIARASRLDWVDIRCEGEGTLDRVERVTRFTGITLRATLTVPADVDIAKATRLLEKAEHTCLVSNSLAFPVHLEPKVQTAS